MNEPEELMARIVDLEEQLKVSEMAPPTAEQLIACLEGEIAKRDETIARLEADNRSKNGSIKAFGEQIAGLQKAVRNRERLVGLRDARILELEAKYLELASLSSRVSVELPIACAAPVSEAKAQGVVQWPDADEIMQMAFEEGQPADDASGYFFELEEFDLFIERLMSEVASLNDAPAAPAADASDVLDQAMYTLISIGYHENSGLVHELRQALAAHRAKGVV